MRLRPTMALKPDDRSGPALLVHYQPISMLKLNPKNARIHSARQIREIASSIDSFGFNVPALVDADNNVVAGHGRILAVRELGWSHVPTISLNHLSETQARAFAIADNRLNEKSAWNDQFLAEQLKDLASLELDFSIEATGFSMAEIDLRIEGFDTKPDKAEDSADAIPNSPTGPPICQPCDLWLLGKHKLYCGSALDRRAFAALHGHEHAAMVFADPPYNVRIDGHAGGLGAIHHREFAMASGEMDASEYTNFLSDTLALATSYSVDGTIHYVCMDWRHSGELLAAASKVYSEIKNICVWVKHNAGMGSLYRSQHEFVFVFKHGRGPHRNNIQLGQFGRYRTNVWNYPGANSFGRTSEEGNLLALHPTVKPVALVVDAILDCSARGDLILDPFLGIGTSILAAERTGRRCYGIEIDPLYADTAIRRWQKFTGDSARHAASGRAFDELNADMVGRA